MDDSEGKNFEHEQWKTPFALKVWVWEAEISESIYKFWCKITGGQFNRREKERPNSCILVTRRGFHLLSTLLSRKLTISPSQLEVYQMNCPEEVPYGLGVTAYSYQLLKNANCNFCGRCYEVQEGDKRIVGKFRK